MIPLLSWKIEISCFFIFWCQRVTTADRDKYHSIRVLIVTRQVSLLMKKNLINLKSRVVTPANVDNISPNNTVTVMDSYDTGVCVGEGEGGRCRRWLRQYFGNNYLEIMRLADLTAGPLPWSRKKKTKVNSKQVSLCFEFSPHLIDSRYNQPQWGYLMLKMLRQHVCVR